MSTADAFNTAQKPEPGELIAATRTKVDGDIETMKSLLQRGSSVDEKDTSGSTALLWAARGGSLEKVQLLIANNADLNIANDRGHTALSSALRNGHIDIVRLLIEKNADINTKTVKSGKTALIATIIPSMHRSATPEIIQAALNSDIHLDEKDNSGRTALMWAAHYNYPEITQALIDKGASLDETDNEGDTALDIAEKASAPLSAQILRDVIETRQRISEEKARVEAIERESIRHAASLEKHQLLRDYAPGYRIKIRPVPL